MVKSLKYFIIFTFMCVALAGSTYGQNAEHTESILARLDKNMTAASAYQFGQNWEMLAEISDIVKITLNTPGLQKPVEKRFIKFLKSDATLAGKQFICRKLSIIGSQSSISTLSKMLRQKETYDMALFALERIPSEAADKALLKALSKMKGRMRMGIVNSIGVRSYSKSVSKLTKLIYEQDLELAQAAISALGKIADKNASKALWKASEKTTDRLKTAALNGYLKCTDKLVDEGDVAKAKTIYQELTHPNYPEEIRSAAFAGMIHAEPERGGDIILDVLQNGDSEIKSAALFHLSRLPKINNLKNIAEELPNLEAIHQVQLCAALAERNDPSILQTIVEAASYNDTDVRIAALKALIPLGDGSTVDLLCRAAIGEGPEAETARESLYRVHGKDVDKVIISKLPHSEPAIKVQLLTGIGERNIESAVKTVLTYKDDLDSKVRREAIKTLAKISSPEHLPELIDIIIHAKTDEERQEAEKTVVHVARKIDDKENQAKDVLAALPSAGDVESKSSLYQVMGKIGDTHTLPEIKSALKAKNKEIQKAGIRAMSEWPTAVPIPDLLKIAETSKQKVQQILAVRGYIRLIGLDTEHNADEKPQMYKKAFDLSSEMNEKRLVLSGLSNIRSVAALEMAGGYLEEASLKQEGEVAVLKIASRIWQNSPEVTAGMLKKILSVTTDDERKQQAERILKRISDL